MKRKGLWMAVLLGVALALSTGSIAVAVVIEFPPTVKLGGRFDPTTLPRHRLARLGFQVFASISRHNGSQPPVLKEATIDFKKSAAIDTTGLPLCKLSQLEGRDRKATRRICGSSVVGTGVASVDSESTERLTTVPLTLFNGGTNDKATVLFIQPSITVATPLPMVIPVKVVKIDKGPFRLQASAEIPPLAGEGSIFNFLLVLKRLVPVKGTTQGYAMASCPKSRHLLAIVTFRFDTGSTIEGTIDKPCRQTG
jgi:hypothetical protein